MARETKQLRRARTLEIITQLKATFPNAHCALHHANALELLIATILSTQCTDARVNIVTPVLFKRFATATALAAAPQSELEGIIKSTGFFRAKARSIKEAAADIVNKHHGEVPQTMEALTALRGVGRKTANVVLGNAFGMEVGIVVDTHVGRLSRRLGLTRHTDAEKVERDLMELVPQNDWTLFSHLLISHGRRYCTARNPNCGDCPLQKLCPSAFKHGKPAAKSKSKPARDNAGVKIGSTR